MIAATLLWLTPVGARAQTVYRCGDQYSATALCQSGTTPALQDTRPAEQTKAQERLTQQTQREAQALEKSRLQAERQASVTPPPAAPSWPQDASTANAGVAANNTLTTNSRHAHSKKASPYFTAKEASSHAKTKGNQKASTP